MVILKSIYQYLSVCINLPLTVPVRQIRSSNNYRTSQLVQMLSRLIYNFSNRYFLCNADCALSIWTVAFVVCIYNKKMEVTWTSKYPENRHNNYMVIPIFKKIFWRLTKLYSIPTYIIKWLIKCTFQLIHLTFNGLSNIEIFRYY